MTALTNRLGIYNDDVYWLGKSVAGPRISTDRAFLLFACDVGEHFDRLVLFGRALHSSTPADYLLPAEVEVVELPHYSNLLRLREVVMSVTGTAVCMWRGLDEIDTIWVFGPHPFAFLLIGLAALRRKRIVLGVRLDTLEYYRRRMPSRRWMPVLASVWMMEIGYRLLARRLKTTVVGATIARRYGSQRPSVLPMTVSLVRASDIAPYPPSREWTGPIRLLTVGRLEPEKNPFLLVDALAALERARPGRFRLSWIGRGALEEEVRGRAATLGVGEALELRGYLPFGPELLSAYREAHIFVHVSLTEGVPQVLIEALASGTPIVATDVGGVRDAFAGGDAAALLVPPGDLPALVEAVLRISDDEQLRREQVLQGLELARKTTRESESDRVAQFIAAGS